MRKHPHIYIYIYISISISISISIYIYTSNFRGCHWVPSLDGTYITQGEQEAAVASDVKVGGGTFRNFFVVVNKKLVVVHP